MKLRDCPDIPAGLRACFGRMISGTDVSTSDPAFDRLDTERPVCIDRNNREYRELFAETLQELRAS